MGYICCFIFIERPTDILRPEGEGQKNNIRTISEKVRTTGLEGCKRCITVQV